MVIKALRQNIAEQNIYPGKIPDKIFQNKTYACWKKHAGQNCPRQSFPGQKYSQDKIIIPG